MLKKKIFTFCKDTVGYIPQAYSVSGILKIPDVKGALLCLNHEKAA